LYSEDYFLLSTSSQRYGKEEDPDPVPLVPTSQHAGRIISVVDLRDGNVVLHTQGCILKRCQAALQPLI